MAFGKKFLEVLGFNGQDGYEENRRYDEYDDSEYRSSGYSDEYVEPEVYQEPPVRRISPFDRFRSLPEAEDYNAGYEDNDMRIVLLQPMRFEEAQIIARNLLDKKVVVFDLQECDIDEAVNIVNFVSGAVFALRGSIQKINDRGAIFVAVPPSVSMENELRGGFVDGDYGPTIADWVNHTRSRGDF